MYGLNAVPIYVLYHPPEVGPNKLGHPIWDINFLWKSGPELNFLGFKFKKTFEKQSFMSLSKIKFGKKNFFVKFWVKSRKGVEVSYSIL